jgi:tetratricopeptide (TPR) repeat protein
MKQRHSVFWVRADTLTNFIADYSQIMGMLDSDDTQPAQNGSAPSLLEMIRNKLEELSEDWVLILDNADHLDGFLGTGKEEKSISIAQYIPRRGRILITTRDRRFQGSIAAAKDGMCVELMSGQEAESLLLKSVPEHLVQQNLANAFMISELVEELGYLPLAIAQAAANIVDQQLSFAEYVRLFQEKKRRLQLMKSPAFDFANRDPRNGIQSVHVTWEISIDVLRAHAPRPLVFLRYLACYHWRDVPQMVVKALPEFKELDVAEFLKTAKRPLGLSLIEQTDDETGGMTTYSMHPLLHELLLKDVNLEDRRQYLDRTIALMSNIFPFELEKGGKKWALATFLSPHAARHVELAQDAECKSQSLALLMLRLSSLYGQSAMLKAGAEISVRSVKMASELWDAKSLTTFYFRKNNQIRLNDSARYPEAEEEAAVLFKLLEAPEIANYLGESTVEEQRIDIQTTFAVTLRGLRSSRFGELETLHRSQLQSGHLDPWSSQGIVARHNLAHALLKQGRFEEAMAVNTELLAFCETENGIRLVGKPLHLIMLNLRALIFRSDGSLEANKEEVVEIYKRVFRESQEHLGIKEVDTWLATNNVCGILLQLNREGEMGPILWEAIPRAIAAKIKTEGKFDQCVMEVYHKAIQYLESVPSKHGGNCKETIEFKELLETWKFTARLYDASIDPSQQMDALNNIGVFRQYNGKYDEAEKFHIQAIELCELHNQTQGLPLFRYNQMLAIARAGRTVEAEAYRRRYLDLILLEEANYGSLESRMKEFEEDRSLYQQAKEMVVQGTLMKESQWYQVNIKSIGRAERRYGELFS